MLLANGRRSEWTEVTWSASKPADWCADFCRTSAVDVLFVPYAASCRAKDQMLQICSISKTALPNDLSYQAFKVLFSSAENWLWYTVIKRKIRVHTLLAATTYVNKKSNHSWQRWRQSSTRFHQGGLSWALPQELHMPGLQVVDATLDLNLTCSNLQVPVMAGMWQNDARWDNMIRCNMVMSSMAHYLDARRNPNTSKNTPIFLAGGRFEHAKLYTTKVELSR